MNKITLIGRTGTDPETKKVADTTVCKISLATSEKYTNKNGEKVEETTWHSLEFWGKLAEIADKFVKKGDKLAVIGTQKHEKHEEKYYSKVKVSDMEMLGGGSSYGNEDSRNDSDNSNLPF